MTPFHTNVRHFAFDPRYFIMAAKLIGNRLRNQKPDATFFIDTTEETAKLFPDDPHNHPNFIVVSNVHFLWDRKGNLSDKPDGSDLAVFMDRLHLLWRGERTAERGVSPMAELATLFQYGVGASFREGVFQGSYTRLSAGFFLKPMERHIISQREDGPCVVNIEDIEFNINNTEQRNDFPYLLQNGDLRCGAISTSFCLQNDVLTNEFQEKLLSGQGGDIPLAREVGIEVDIDNTSTIYRSAVEKFIMTDAMISRMQNPLKRF